MAKLKRNNIFLITFISNLRSYDKKDFAPALLLAPIIVLSIFFMPYYIKKLLALYPKNIALWSLFTSNYVHFELEHMALNLISYVAYIFLAMAFESDRKRFWAMLLVILIVAPVVASCWWIFIIANTPLGGPSIGFSTSVYCSFGYLLYLLTDLIGRKYRLFGHMLFLLVFTTVLISFLFNEIIADGKIINVVAHYLGFVLGGFLPFL